MKTLKYIFLSFTIAIFLNSCIDIIELKLKNTEPRIIIEAIVDGTDSTCTVIATYSNSFYDTTEFENIEGLNILLKNGDATYNQYIQKPTGEYVFEDVIVNPGDTFDIKIIDTEGKEYNSKAVAPKKPGFFLVLFAGFPGPDSTYIDSNGIERKFMFGVSYCFDVSPDPDFYRYKIYKKDKYYADIYNFVDDAAAIGDTMQTGFRAFFSEGDTITFRLYTINKETYDYFYQINDIQGSGFNGTAPYNPKGNFDNDALGYFCIQYYIEEPFIVMEYPFFPKKIIKR